MIEGDEAHTPGSRILIAIGADFLMYAIYVTAMTVVGPLDRCLDSGSAWMRVKHL